MESVHHVSVSSKILFSKVRKIVPPMLEKFHKGLLSSGSSWLSIIGLLLAVETGTDSFIRTIGTCSGHWRMR